MMPLSEFQDDCNRVLATVGIAAADTLPIEKRIMLCRAIAHLFPVDSEERIEAEQTATSLADAEKSQLRLTQLLK